MAWGSGKRNAALLDAVRASDVAVVKDLLAKGADPNAAETGSAMPNSWQMRLWRWRLNRGIARGEIDARLLFSAPVHLPEPAIVLAESKVRQEEDAITIIDALLDAGADINAANGLGNTPLINAAYQGKIKIVQLLVARGASVHRRSKAGSTALTVAKRLEIVQCLLHAGADIDAQGSFRSTALMKACYSPSDYPIAKFLLEAGADPSLKNAAGNDALATAESNGCEETAKLLLAYLDGAGRPEFG